MKDEFRAMTNNDGKHDNAVMTSSEMPSAKNSCSGSALILVNGNTATDGLSGSGKAVGGVVGSTLAADGPMR